MVVGTSDMGKRGTMARRARSGALVVLATLLLADRPAAHAADEYQCRRDGLMRRVELGGSGAGRPVPCEVVYWKDSEQPGIGQTLWRAATDPQYCEDQARAFVAQLRTWGWQCERLGAGVEPQTAAVLPTIKPLPPVSPRRRGPLGDAEAAGLAEVIRHTLESLGRLYPGVFEGEVADYGDLDGDGFQDAAVIITHHGDGGGTVQYLVAYLFDGKGYHSVASRTVSGRSDDPYRGEVEQIVDGAILLTLRAEAEPAARSRGAAFVLQEGRLVELE